MPLALVASTVRLTTGNHRPKVAEQLKIEQVAAPVIAEIIEVPTERGRHHQRRRGLPAVLVEQFAEVALRLVLGSHAIQQGVPPFRRAGDGCESLDPLH